MAKSIKSWIYKLIEPQTLVLIATVVVAAWIGITQNNINREIEQTSVAPIILRNGVLGNWDDIRKNTTFENQLTFAVYDHLAINVTGYMVYNGFKYPLSFSLAKGKLCLAGATTTMEWVAPPTNLCALPEWNNGIKTSQLNGMEISYKDIEDHSYCTKEEADFNEIITSACD